MMSASTGSRWIRLSIAVMVAALATACTITQQVHPARIPVGSEICIIEDPKVRAGFVDEVRRSLIAAGYRYRMLPAGSGTTDCPVAMTYTARWSWDLTIYMSYARLQIFVEGSPAGDAVYDSTGGGGNLGKFIDAETKIKELVSQLLSSPPT
jgi:hypothetical protein